MHSFQKTNPRTRFAAMTLVEIMVAMAIGVVIIGAATWFTVEGTKASLRAMANVENGIQQWGLNTKLQIDSKIANGATIFASADTSTWVGGLPVEVPVDNGVAPLERGKILVLTKSQLDSAGNPTAIITNMIFYYYTGGSLAATGTLKRYPPKAPDTYPISTPIDPGTGQPYTVAQLVSQSFSTLTGDAALVQDNLASIATKGPFAHLGSTKNVSIALVREETSGGTVKSSNLTEVSFNLR